MRILIVSGLFPPMRTGTAFYTRNLAVALKSHGHEVEVVTVGKPGFTNEEGLAIHRLSAIYLPLAGFFKHFRLCVWNPANWWRLIRIGKNSRAEVILLMNHYLDIGLPARMAAISIKFHLNTYRINQYQSEAIRCVEKAPRRWYLQGE